MSRLGIFVFYDEKGYVGEYIDYLLEDIQAQLEYLIVVCNGILSEDGRKTFEKYADEIIIRPNIGFDAGAYQEIIKRIYDEGIIENYDELLLFNDTFFGPFYSFQSIFSTMEKKNVDFWGISWHQSEYIPRHIQSYFMNFGSQIVRSRCLYDFFMGVDIDEHNVLSIITHMEFILTEYLEQAGFLWSTYVEKNVGVRLYCYPHEFLVHEGLPILKIKTFGYSEEVDPQIVKSVKYLKENGLYDIGLIEKQIWHKFKRKLSGYRNGEDVEDFLPVPTTNLEGVKRFSDSFPGVYIYGAGFYGRIIMRYIGRENVRGFVVSDKHYSETDYEGIKVYKLSQIENKTDRMSGLIVALNAQYTEEVRKHLKAFQNVLFLWK